MRKRSIVVGMALLTLFILSGSASAWDGHSLGGHRWGGYDRWGGDHRGQFGFGLLIGPPAVYVAPPSAYYYAPPRRAWVAGYWDWRWFGKGWKRVWIPGYWQ
jgi:hypothetical protein